MKKYVKVIFYIFYILKIMMNMLPTELIDNIAMFCDAPTSVEVGKLGITSRYVNGYTMTIKDALKTNQSAYTVFLCYVRWYKFAEKFDYIYSTCAVNNSMYENIVAYNRYDIVEELEKYIILYREIICENMICSDLVYTKTELNEIILVKYRYELVSTALIAGSLDFIKKIINIYPEKWNEYWREPNLLAICFLYRDIDDPNTIKILDWLVEMGIEMRGHDFIRVRGNKHIINWHRQRRKMQRKYPENKNIK